MKKILLRLLNFYYSLKWRKCISSNNTKLVRFYRTSHISFLYGAGPGSVIIDGKARIHGVIQTCKDGKVFLGNYTQLGPNSKIYSLSSVIIGDFSAIASNVTICDNNNHPINPTDRMILRQTPEGSFERSWIHSDSKEILIGRNVWIGENSRICKGVTIGDNSIVAANSVVTKDVPANSIAAGNPAKIVKSDIDKITSSAFLFGSKKEYYLEQFLLNV